MNKQASAYILAVLSLLSMSNINAQQRLTEKHFGLVGHLGLGWDGRSQWQFNSLGSGSLSPLKKGLSFGGGIEYGPLTSIRGANLMTSLEVGYSQESSSKDLAGGKAESKLRRIPVMAWAKLISEGEFSPFVRLGVGVARTEFGETASLLPGQEFDFAKWHFSWGAGAGLNYQITQQTAFELFLDSWMSEADIMGTNASGVTYGLNGRFVMFIIGIRGIVAL